MDAKLDRLLNLIPNAQHQRFRSLWPWLAAALVFLLAFGMAAWRLNRAPDIFTDEILYTRAGIRVAGEGALVWDHGNPIFVHPPLYFLAEAAYWRLTRSLLPPQYATGDIFDLVYHARYLNAIFAGLTATLLYLIGRRLHGMGLGLLLAIFFVLDPFGLRINRRAMLETMAALLTLSGMAILLAGTVGVKGRAWLPRALLAGLLLGLALLVKELAFTSLLAVFLYGLWELWQDRRARLTRSGPPGEQAALERAKSAPWQALLAVAVAVLTYTFYPLWMLVTGHWSGFSQVKWLSLQRLLGLIHLSGWNRPGVSLADFLAQRLADYGSSYLLLALGGVATLWLLGKHRHSQTGRLLALWGLVLYPFYGLVALFGSGNDQFFYFLLVPAILLVGSAIALLPSTIGGARLRHPRILAVTVLLILILPYNLARWWTAYGAGLDNSYHQLASYVERNLPAGEPLNATGDALKFQYFFPQYPITSAGTPEEARTVGVRYFALAPKDVQSRYGRVTPDLAAWLADEGQQLFSVSGDSYGAIHLYRVDYDDGAAHLPEARAARARQRSFQPALGGWLGSFLLALGLWSVLIGGLATWFSWRQLRFQSRYAREGHSTGSWPTLEAERERA